MTLLAFLALSLPAIADDCTSAMVTTAQNPVTTLTIKTDAHGKQAKFGMVQTPTTQYIQTEDGQWHSVGVTVKDKIDATNEDLKTAKISCQREGADLVNGVPATVYAVHADRDGDISDAKVWISSHRIAKTEGTSEGAHYTTSYDYAHVIPPANAKPMGSR
ncbi:MAG: hypothetical protein ABI330_08370 [Caldimonas sp.]